RGAVAHYSPRGDRGPLMPATRSLLMVEGKNDRHVVYALRDHHGIPDCFDVKDYDGVDALLEALPERLDESDRERLGLILDADPEAGPAARWDAVRNNLLSDGYADPPKRPDHAGTALSAPDHVPPKAGAWSMRA